MATITADGSVTLTLFPGRIYTIAAGGDFGGGSLAASLLLDDDTPVPITGFPITGGAIVNFSAGATRLRLTLTGSTDPEISYAVTPAGAEASADTLTNKTLINPTITNYTESVVAIGNSSTAQTIALTNGTFQTVTLTGNCTFTMPTATAGKSFILKVMTGAGGFTATFTGVKWPENTAPTITTTASRYDLISFVADGTAWSGSAAQNFTP